MGRLRNGKKIGILMIAVWTIAGCSGGMPAGLAPADLTTPVSTPLGKFTGQQVDQKISAKAFDCSGKNQMMDERLMTGQIFTTEEQWLNQDGRYADTGTINSRINAVDFNQSLLRKDTNVTYPDGSHDRFRQVCRFDTQVVCQPFGISSSSASRFSKAQDTSTHADCTLTSDGKNDRHLSRAGSYAFANGQTVPAIRTEDKSEGTVSCKKADGSLEPVGHGSQLTIRIASPQIPNVEALTCGDATNIFVYDVIKADDGKILALKKYELTGLRL